MADEIAPVSAPSPEPAAAAPVAQAAPLVSSAPIVDAAPAAEAGDPPAPAADPAASSPAAEGGEPAPAAVEEPKPAEPPVEAPKLEGEKPAEEAKAAEPAPPPAYEFKLPEGVNAAPEQITAFNTVLGKYGLSQEAGQELMDLHASTLKSMQDHLAQGQQDAFTDTRAQWVKDFDKRAGNKRDTLLNDAKWVVTDTIKDAKERDAFWNALGVTGAGDHPDVIMGMAKIAKRLRERTAPPPPISPRDRSANPAERRYGGTNR